ATGALLAIVTGTVPDQAPTWECGVVQRRKGEVRPVIGSGEITETVAGVDLRISADAFFQNNTAGAAALVDLVAGALVPQPGETMLDAYAGGGLFGLTVGKAAAGVIAVESDPLAVGDLRHNGTAASVEPRVVAAPFASAQIGGRWDVAVVDPPRDGLGAAGVEAVTRGRPRAIAYVSCDPASLARDCRTLAETGYRLQWAAPVDLFPQTFHIETVAAFAAG
ncbi:MAG TPA: hypothetical protein DCY40_07805, partial [Actinobacteria bacterium]|nr:hypothetical protein [Actinomycetota bacterium]